MSAITPFSANADQAVLDDLRERLARTRFSPEVTGAGSSQGLPEAVARDWVERWQTSFDWRAWEARLNALPQFTFEHEGLNVFFIHVRSTVETATPLMLIHGWPGSVLEFLDAIPMLTDPVAHGGSEEDAFHVVIPAIPNFGYSGPNARNVTQKEIVAAFIALMAELGYDQYGTQGGDFGAFLAPEMARQAPDRVIGAHINAASYGFIPWEPLSDEEQASLEPFEKVRYDRLQQWNADGSGYFQIMATRPQTIGYGLTDSPVGLLAWIGEKFADWSDNPDGTPGGAIDPDVILAHATLYWVTNTATSSARMYWAAMHNADWPGYLTQPLGVLNLAQDVAIRRFGEQGHNIQHWTEGDRGGHFAALEVPEVLVNDVRAFFAKVRSGEAAPVEPPRQDAQSWG
jgi:pimeloyl-ACP methyl ester carboxylesterase